MCFGTCLKIVPKVKVGEVTSESDLGCSSDWLEPTGSQPENKQNDFRRRLTYPPCWAQQLKTDLFLFYFWHFFDDKNHKQMMLPVPDRVPREGCDEIYVIVTKII